MAKSVAVFLWFVGAASALWGLHVDIRFWNTLEAALAVAGGMSAALAGALFFVLGDIADTLRKLEQVLRMQPPQNEKDAVFDVSVNNQAEKSPPLQ